MSQSDWEELETSPVLTVSVSKQSATREFLVPGGDEVEFINAYIPVGISGQRSGVSYPGLAFLRVDTIEFRPFADNPNEGSVGVNATNTFDFLRATVTYTTPDSGTQEGDGDTLLTESVTTGGEFLTLKSESLEWDTGPIKTDDAGDPILDPVTGEPERDKTVSEEIQAALIIPTQEIRLTRSFVARPNFAAFRNAVGKVNNANFFGADPGTLLFVGADRERQFTVDGATAWRIDMRFSEKRIIIDDEDNIGGWNHFLRTDGTWEILTIKNEGGDPQKVYKEFDFALLLL